MSWKRAEMVSVKMRAAAVDGVGDRSDALIDGLDRLRRASVSDEARWVSRESIAWIAWAAPSVSVVASEPSRPSMVSVTDFGAGVEVVSSNFRRLSTDSSNDLSLPSSEVSRLATRLPSVVSNCSRRWSSEA